ncbi:hypothetical protein [Caudoviricetes sp.]|nr:hypothetical protein [Caudoviricetes sp.]UOF81029.1 hypothetical protein [Caudoviricetes sp.]UOF81383.1 hypothetical protein [Caudoviricetes sp.]
MPLTNNNINASLGGNTSGAMALISTGTMSLIGGNNITLSQAGNAVTISGGAGGGGAGSNSVGMSNLGNTAGTTGIVSDTAVRFLFAGGNNITLSQSLNGVSGTITISGENVSQYLTTAALSQDSSKYAGIGETVGTVAGTDLGLTVNTDGVSIKHPLWLTTAALSQDSSKYAGIGETVSTVAGTDLGLTVNTVGVSIVHPNWLTTAALSQNSSNYAGVGETVGTTNGTNLLMTVNTDGVSILHPNWLTAAEGAGAFSGGLSNIGNTSGDTGVVASRLVLAGGNNITLSGSTNGSSATVTISAFNQSAESQSIGMSNLGNTSGTTGVASGAQVQAIIAGGNNITISQSVDGASGTLTVSGANAGAQNMSFWQNMGVNGSATDAMAQTQTSNGELRIFQLDIGNNIFAGNMTVNTALLDMTFNRTFTIGNFTWKLSIGLYTLNGSNLALLYSASTGISSSQATGASFNISTAIHGPRYLTFDGSTQFSTVHSTAGTGNSSALTLSQGLYYMGIIVQSSSNNFSASYFGAILGESGQRSGTFGTSTVTQTWMGRFPWMGIYSATTTQFPLTILNSFIKKTDNAANFIPHIVFNNLQGATIF